MTLTSARAAELAALAPSGAHERLCLWPANDPGEPDPWPCGCHVTDCPEARCPAVHDVGGKVTEGRCECGPAPVAETPEGNGRRGPVNPDGCARRWVIEMPAGTELLNSNQRHSWRYKARVTATLRETAARIARVPRLDQVRIEVEYQPSKVTRSRDGGNWAPSGKACIDGLRDAGVLPDDNSKHVLSETYSIGEPYPKGRLVLTITEAAGGER